jgi:hypothetical protein
MAGSNTHMWMLVLLAVLIIALVMGMNMLVESKPMVQELLTVRDATATAYPGSRLTHQWEPPLEVEVQESQSRTRGLVLRIPTSREILADRRPGGKAARLVAAARQVLDRNVRYQENLNEKLNWIRIILETDEEGGGRPFEFQEEYVPHQQRSRWNRDGGR